MAFPNEKVKNVLKEVEKGRVVQSGDQKNLDETLLDARDVSRLLKCSVPLIYKMVGRGQISSIKWKCPGVGTKKPRTMVRFRKDDIFDFIERNYRAT